MRYRRGNRERGEGHDEARSKASEKRKRGASAHSKGTRLTLIQVRTDTACVVSAGLERRCTSKNSVGDRRALKRVSCPTQAHEINKHNVFRFRIRSFRNYESRRVEFEQQTTYPDGLECVCDAHESFHGG